MGRWSRLVADRFVDALELPAGSSVLDVGCGTGVLLDAVVEGWAPARAVGLDPSADFLRLAAERLRDRGAAAFDEGRADALPTADGTFDAAVSGLALNFTDDAGAAIGEMARVVRPGGTVAGYVWDYDHPDFFLTRLWDAALAVDGERGAGDERGRWSICTAAGMAAVVDAEPLGGATTWSITVPTAFADADELWSGFLLGVGPSGTWVAGLDDDRRERVRAALEAALPRSADGTVHLTARALAFAARRRG